MRKSPGHPVQDFSVFNAAAKQLGGLGSSFVNWLRDGCDENLGVQGLRHGCGGQGGTPSPLSPGLDRKTNVFMNGGRSLGDKCFDGALAT